MRLARLGVAMLMTLAWVIAPLSVRGASPVLLRYPYLTDVVGSWAEVSFATDTLSPAPVVSWGLGSGDCSNPANVTTATYVTGFGTNDKQFKARMLGLQANTAYCYRILQGGVDVLGSAPVFTSALASGAGDPFTFAVIGDWGAGTTDESKVIAQIAAAQPSFIVTVGDNVYNSGTQTEYGDINGGNAFAPPYWPQVGRTIPAFPAEGNHGFSGSLPYLQNWPEDGTVAACAAAGCRYQRDSYCCTGTLGTSTYNYPSAWYAFDWGNSRFYILEGAWGDSTGGYQGDFQARWNGAVSGCAICGAEMTWLSGDLASHQAAHKFAFFHYPLHSDNGSQTTDTYLDGPSGLEGLLASNGVHIVFNGHAHDYERNYPQIAGSSMLTYISGGGGDPLGGISGHSAFDAYSKAIYHYLKVTVNGSSVTVTPIDENGAVFDQQSYNFTGSAPANDFSIAASPSSASAAQGQTATATVSTAIVTGSAQTVNLSASGLPGGATASFSPTSVTAGGSSTLTLAPGASTPPGTYTVTVTGTSASATHTSTLALTVAAADDFSIAVSPATISLGQGTTSTSTVSTAVVSGSAQSVTLSATGLPAGVTASFNPASVTAGSTSTLTVTTSGSSAPGTYAVTVTGTGVNATHTAALSLTVTAPDDFSISVSPSAISVGQGAASTSTVSTSVVSGSAQSVSLSASGLPTGVTASFNPASVTAGSSSTLTVTASGSSTPGTYTVTVTGTGTSTTHTTTLSLTVTAPSDFSIAASPASVSMTQGQGGASTVSTAVVSGTAQTVTLSASGLPAGATASFAPASLTAGASSTLSIATSASTPSGTYSLTVTATGTSATHTAVVTVTVSAPTGSGPAFVQASGANETASATSLTATFSSATHAGDLLVLSASVYTGATNQVTKVTDSAGNTWTKVGAYCTAGHNSDGEVWYAANANPATTVTVTVTTAAVVAMEVVEFSGVAATSPLDGAAGASNTGTSADSGAATPAGGNDLAIVFVAGHASAQAVTITTSGFTAQPQQTSSNAGATPASIVVAYRTPAVAGAQDATGSFSSTMYWAAGVVFFKSA